MPNKRSTLDEMREQLAQLPRLPAMTLVGGPCKLHVTVTDGDNLIQPDAMLWVESPSGFVRAFELIDPHATAQAQTDQVLDAFCAACAQPMGQGRDAPTLPDTSIVDLAAVREQRQTPRAPDLRPGLPLRVTVTDRALADALRPLVEPLGVPVVFAEHTPEFDAAAEALGEFVDRMMPEEGNEPFEWDADVAHVRALCKATASYYRRAPWDYMPETPPIQIDLGANGPEAGVAALYASILGGGGLVSGVAFYYSLADVIQAMENGADLEPAEDEDIDAMIAMLKQSGVPVDQIPPDVLHEMVGNVLAEQGVGGPPAEEVAQNSLAVLFASDEETGSSYIEWFKARDIKLPAHEGLPMFVRTEIGQKTRHPTDQEVIAITLGVEALNQFFTRHKHALDGPLLPPEALTLQAHVTAGDITATIRVTFPPPDWDDTLEADAGDDEGNADEDLDEDPR